MTKIILDTDLGSDCDDMGALTILHHLADEGKAEILCCTHCGTDESAHITLQVTNAHLGRPALPLGRYTAHPFLEEEACRRYSAPIAARYRAAGEFPPPEDATRLLRRMLATNTDVVLVTIGMLNNIAALLRSAPDDISDLPGLELCRRSVRCMYTMGGHFSDPTYAEYNIHKDAESAIYVATYFPCPIYYVGFEAGVQVMTGVRLQNSPADCPVRQAYAAFGGLRPSWDPLTVYAAILPDSPLFSWKRDVRITFSPEATTVVYPGGKDGYLVPLCPPAVLATALDAYLWT